MEDLTRDQPGHGLEAHVGMRPDLDPFVFGDRRRTHVVGEAPRADRPSDAARQHPAHLERADLRPAPFEQLDQLGLARRSVAVDATVGVGVCRTHRLHGCIVDFDRTAHEVPPFGHRRVVWYRLVIDVNPPLTLATTTEPPK
ncbi:MAG: hypothetical protein WB565_11960 [Acidimicrobiales bacterium]